MAAAAAPDSMDAIGELISAKRQTLLSWIEETQRKNYSSTHTGSRYHHGVSSVPAWLHKMLRALVEVAATGVVTELIAGAMGPPAAMHAGGVTGGGGSRWSARDEPGDLLQLPAPAPETAVTGRRARGVGGGGMRAAVKKNGGGGDGGDGGGSRVLVHPVAGVIADGAVWGTHADPWGDSAGIAAAKGAGMLFKPPHGHQGLGAIEAVITCLSMEETELNPEALLQVIRKATAHLTGTSPENPERSKEFWVAVCQAVGRPVSMHLGVHGGPSHSWFTISAQHGQDTRETAMLTLPPIKILFTGHHYAAVACPANVHAKWHSSGFTPTEHEGHGAAESLKQAMRAAAHRCMPHVSQNKLKDVLNGHDQATGYDILLRASQSLGIQIHVHWPSGREETIWEQERKNQSHPPPTAHLGAYSPNHFTSLWSIEQTEATQEVAPLNQERKPAEGMDQPERQLKIEAKQQALEQEVDRLHAKLAEEREARESLVVDRQSWEQKMARLRDAMAAEEKVSAACRASSALADHQVEELQQKLTTLTSRGSIAAGSRKDADSEGAADLIDAHGRKTTGPVGAPMKPPRGEADLEAISALSNVAALDRRCLGGEEATAAVILASTSAQSQWRQQQFDLLVDSARATALTDEAKQRDAEGQIATKGVADSEETTASTPSRDAEVLAVSESTEAVGATGLKVSSGTMNPDPADLVITGGCKPSPTIPQAIQESKLHQVDGIITIQITLSQLTKSGHLHVNAKCLPTMDVDRCLPITEAILEGHSIDRMRPKASLNLSQEEVLTMPWSVVAARLDRLVCIIHPDLKLQAVDGRRQGGDRKTKEHPLYLLTDENGQTAQHLPPYHTPHSTSPYQRFLDSACNQGEGAEFEPEKWSKEGSAMPLSAGDTTCSRCPAGVVRERMLTQILSSINVPNKATALPCTVIRIQTRAAIGSTTAGDGLPGSQEATRAGEGERDGVGGTNGAEDGAGEGLLVGPLLPPPRAYEVTPPASSPRCDEHDWVVYVGEDNNGEQRVLSSTFHRRSTRAWAQRPVGPEPPTPPISGTNRTNGSTVTPHQPELKWRLRSKEEKQELTALAEAAGEEDPVKLCLGRNWGSALLLEKWLNRTSLTESWAVAATLAPFAVAILDENGKLVSPRAVGSPKLRQRLDPKGWQAVDWNQPLLVAAAQPTATHWNAMAFYRESKKILIWDSLKNNLKIRDSKAWARGILYMARHYGYGARWGELEDWTIELVQDAPQQTGSYDCAFNTGAVIISLLSNSPITHSSANIEAVRMDAVHHLTSMQISGPWSR